MNLMKIQPKLKAGQFASKNQRIRQLRGALLESEQISNTDLRNYPTEEVTNLLDFFVEKFMPQGTVEMNDCQSISIYLIKIQLLMDQKGETDNNITRVGDFSNPLSTINR